MGFGRGTGFTTKKVKLGSKVTVSVAGVSQSISTAGKLTTSVTAVIT